MFNNEDCIELKKFIYVNFPDIYFFVKDTDLCIYMLGGAVKDIINNIKPKDLDFVILNYNNNYNYVDDFIKILPNTYKINKNKFGGTKINTQKIEIDIWQTNDLYKAIEYNLDGLFYDINQNKIISFGYVHGIENSMLIQLNDNNKGIIDELKRQKRINKLMSMLKEV